MPSVSVSHLGSLCFPSLQLCFEGKVLAPRQETSTRKCINYRLGCHLSLRALVLRGQQVRE